MNCQEEMELMQRFLDQDLSDAEETVLQAHLRSCPECADLFERLLLLNGELAALPKISPPYSIVDSIMPKLDELGPLTEQGAASEAAEVPSKATEVGAAPCAGRKKKSLFSWKISAGVAAAGLVIGMLIINQWDGTDRKSAEDMLMSSRNDKSVSAGAAAKDQYGAAKQDSGVTAPQSADPAEKKGAGASFTAQSATGTSASDGAAKVPSVREPALAPAGSEKTHPSISGPKVSSPAVGTLGVIDQAGQAVSPGGTTNQESTASPAPADSKFITYDRVSPSPDESVQKPAAMAPAPTPDAGSMSKGFAANSRIAVNPAASLSSPDGSYTAFVKSEGIVITDKDGATVLTSPLSLNSGDSVSLTGWTENAKLAYQVKKADGTAAGYTIDVKAKTVTKN